MPRPQSRSRDADKASAISPKGRGPFVNPDRDSMKGSGSLAPCFLRNEANMYPVFMHYEIKRGTKRHRDSGSSQSSTKVGKGSELYGGDVIGKPPELSVGEERGANIWS